VCLVVQSIRFAIDGVQIVESSRLVLLPSCPKIHETTRDLHTLRPSDLRQNFQILTVQYNELHLEQPFQYMVPSIRTQVQ
jgi:hypothetical protein